MPSTQQISAAVSMSADAAQVVAFDIKMSFGGFLLHFLVQLAHISCPWSERWQRLLSLPVSAMQFLIPALAPAFYIKHRDMNLFATKMAFFSFPLLRKARGIQRALDTPATQGIFGFLVDLTKMAWGAYTWNASAYHMNKFDLIPSKFLTCIISFSSYLQGAGCLLYSSLEF